MKVYAQSHIVVAMHVRLDPRSCLELKAKIKGLFKYNTRNFHYYEYSFE